jgi:carbamoylphosphate synthase large subunit
MVNCNPETVSTDYDTSDRLYFEPLFAEDVLALIKREQANGQLLGCIVQYGGQTPLKLSQALAAAGIPILGTSADAIDIAEDRERFQTLLHQLGLRQPENGIARSADEAEAIAIADDRERFQTLLHQLKPSSRASVSPWSSAPATCSAGGPWKSSMTSPICAATCARRSWSPAPIRC